MSPDRQEEGPKQGLRRSWRLGILLGSSAVWLAVLAGCQTGADKSEDTSETATRLRKLWYPLCDFVEVTKADRTGRPNEQGFKAYLAGLSPQKLADLQIADPQELFVSPRDQKPFVINDQIPPRGSVPVMWEQTGRNGRRYVLYYTDGNVEEIDQETFDKLKLKK